MIVVVGSPAWRDADPAGPAGRACEIALAAAGRGAVVEIVGRAGDDRVGDSLLIALALTAAIGYLAARRAQQAVAARVLVTADPARPERLRSQLRRTRDQLGEIQAGSERALWTMSRLDERVAVTTRTLAEQRARLDSERARLEGIRDGVDRVRSMWRALSRVADLRRTGFDD